MKAILVPCDNFIATICTYPHKWLTVLFTFDWCTLENMGGSKPSLSSHIYNEDYNTVPTNSL